MIYARADRCAIINGPAVTTGRLIHAIPVMAHRNIFFWRQRDISGALSDDRYFSSFSGDCTSRIATGRTIMVLKSWFCCPLRS